MGGTPSGELTFECIPEDCNFNGVRDQCDIDDGYSDDYDLNGIPDECDPDCNDNNIPVNSSINRLLNSGKGIVTPDIVSAVGITI